VRHLGCGVVYFAVPTNYPQGTCFTSLRSTTYMRAPTSDTTTLPAIISSVIFQEVDYVLALRKLHKFQAWKMTIITVIHFVSKFALCVSTTAVNRKLVT